MPRPVPPPLNVALTILRSARGWAQKELAQAVGTSVKVLSSYERGRTHLSRQLLETMAAAMGLEPDAIDLALLVIQQIQPIAEESASPAGPTEAERRGIQRAAAVVATAAADATRSELTRRIQLSRIRQDHEEAAELWACLKNLPAWDRRVLVEGGKEYRSWALAVRLCDESEKAAAAEAATAVELATLAIRVAELTPGEEDWRQRLQGYVWSFLGNARRVAGDFPGAEEAFDQAHRRWRAVSPSDPGILQEWRLPDLEASLRREQRQWDEALRLLSQAQAAAPTGEQSRILLKKAGTLEQCGDHEGAIKTLRQAACHVDVQRKPRLGFALLANLALNLCRLERHVEANDLLLGARRLAVQLGNGLDLVRLRWVEGLAAAGLGRTDEAIEALSHVREEFISRGIAYDAALATLELAALYLKGGRTREVKSLARQMTPIFQAQGVHREALAALELFCQAADRELATVKMVRLLINYLHRARYDPQLHFEGSAE